jgi:hypothetical protein
MQWTSDEVRTTLMRKPGHICKSACMYADRHARATPKKEHTTPHTCARAHARWGAQEREQEGGGEGEGEVDRPILRWVAGKVFTVR